MKTRNVNLTEGSPLKQIIRFSVPLLFGGLLQQLYGIVDMSIVGHYCGLGAFSAVGATGPILFFYIGGIIELVCRGAFAFPMLYAFGYAGVVSTNVLAWVTTAIFDYAFYRHICRRQET